MDNPLIPRSNHPDDADKPDDGGYVLPRGNNLVNPLQSEDSAAAANIIRDKLSKIYASEPDAAQEEQEATEASHKSKHQQFMLELNSSGKDLAQIQTEWHNYYINLPDAEKHQVWQEFYASNKNLNVTKQKLASKSDATEELAVVKNQVTKQPASRRTPKKPVDRRSPQAIRNAVRDSVTAGGKLGVKQHVQSLIFGLGIGFVVIIIFLFGFFNEVFIAPLIQPSRKADATPLIISTSSIAPTTTPEVIIPKINVEIPVNFSETSTDESTIENDLESGVVHYPTTSLPGQDGNTAYFGHSSNNIFNKGKYKFAFVLLHELVPGDTFYITNNDKVYVYKVFSKTIVSPSDVAVLNPVGGHTATATLITCDPPGTSLNRLIIVGDQISPDPNANTATTATSDTAATPTQLVGNGQTLWGHFISQGYGKAIVVVIAAGGVIYVFRRMSRPKDQR